MSLKEELARRAAVTKSKLSSDKFAIMENSITRLEASEMVSNALKTGDMVKDFTLSNATGQQIVFSDILKEKSIVLSFYRGGWCPYCNMELKALQNVLPEIEANGAQLIAISPELPDKSWTTVEKNGLSFEVLSDVNNEVAKAFNLVFKMPEDLQTLYRDQFKIQVDQHNGNNDYELPLSATYVIGQDGKIKYHFVEERYTVRAEPADIIKALKKG